ncbi:Sodium/hydrogen exchanger [Aureobasidium pullulans]|uniref:Sodium/hydrogen exchanger n=1 Tax=Aureobasidium pullulans TaxID=5580 RepID=A0A4S9CW49_AURPU|nr:Sodium/hydrogen exchanger [Aureobasidium pullulans]
MVWDQLEPTPPHLSYLLISSFLIVYCLFATFIRNRLHLSEPPLALLVGILLGPRVLGWLNPNYCSQQGCSGDENERWGWGDNQIQEISRVILGVQVFTVGVGLPKYYASKHWKSVGILLTLVMTFGWFVSALFAALMFKVDVATALVIAACLTPTDPVLSSSILSNSQFSTRVPKRIKDMLSAESGCNDGISFPFLYVGLYALINADPKEAVKNYFLITILWQCSLGILTGLIIGTVFNRLLRFSDGRGYIDPAGMIAFYLLLAIFSVGVGSILGSDDFLVAFGAGYGFARDGWFSKKTKDAHLPDVTDLLLNSALFIYLGTIIPWEAFGSRDITPNVTPWRLFGFAVLVLLFRRIPVMLATYKFNPDIRTFREALFCGHFGPMGLGAVFLAIEARATLETGTSEPLPHPPIFSPPYTNREKATEMLWPVVCFVVMCSTFVHGLSVLALSISSHFRRKEGERAPLLAQETDPLDGMEHEHTGLHIHPQKEEPYVDWAIEKYGTDGTDGTAVDGLTLETLPNDGPHTTSVSKAQTTAVGEGQTTAVGEGQTTAIGEAQRTTKFQEGDTGQPDPSDKNTRHSTSGNDGQRQGAADAGGTSETHVQKPGMAYEVRPASPIQDDESTPESHSFLSSVGMSKVEKAAYVWKPYSRTTHNRTTHGRRSRRSSGHPAGHQTPGMTACNDAVHAVAAYSVFVATILKLV